LGDRPARRVVGGALEGEVLHEVRDAGLVRGLETGAREHVGGDRHRAAPGEARRDHARPLRQGGSLEHRPDGSPRSWVHPGGAKTREPGRTSPPPYCAARPNGAPESMRPPCNVNSWSERSEAIMTPSKRSQAPRSSVSTRRLGSSSAIPSGPRTP